jgi:hypothetical protein
MSVMKIRISNCIFFFLLGLANLCFAGSPELPTELHQSLDLFNKGQLLEAYTTLDSLDNGAANSKEFLFLKAMTKWKMMWLSTYNPSDKKEVIALLDQVDDLCLPGVEEDATMQFYHAAATGLRAQIAATGGDWWKTAKLGKQMKNDAVEILAKDPEFYPANYLLGSYNYFADALPGYLKFLRVFVFLPGGDRKDGLKQLRLAYEKGGITESEAAKTLAIIYTYYERKFQSGKEICDELLERYPPSFDIALYRAINLYFLKDYAGSIASLQELRSDILEYSEKHGEDSVLPVYRPMEREVRYWIARGKIQQRKWDEARALLDDLAEPRVHHPYWLLRGVYLSLAQLDYQAKNIPRAEGWIAKVLQWSDVKESHDKAKKLKKKKGQVGVFDIDFL